MSISVILKTTLYCALFVAGAAANARGGDEEASQMLESALKSGNYNRSQVQSWDARLKVVSGKVMVKTVEGDEWSKVTGEMPLDPNDVVKTSADGVAEVYLDDKGAIALGRNTELEISDLSLEDTVLSLNFGSLVAKIKHSLNEKHKLRVRTPAAVCAIRGTEFAVEYLQMLKEASFAVFNEGRVVVTQADDSGRDAQEYVLEKDTEIHFAPAQKRIRPTPLSRMRMHLGVLAKVRTRLVSLKGWKPRPPTTRAELRNQALRKVIRKQLKDGNLKPKTKRVVKNKAAAKRAKVRKLQAEEEE